MSALLTVCKKELQDHLNSWRFIILFLVMVLVSVYAIFAAASNIREAASGSEYIFLSIFTTPFNTSAGTFLPNSFLSLMSILIPLIGIILGFDAINSERNNGTMSRLVSQPIYRDSIINAKFLAGLISITILTLIVILLISGLGLRLIGVPPSAEEIIRLFFFFVIAVVYGALWLGMAIFFSTLFRQVAVSIVISLALWLFFAFFFPFIYQIIFASMTSNSQAEAIKNVENIIFISRISPIQLFNESMQLILAPSARLVDQVLTLLTEDSGQFFMMTPLSLGQSLLVVWPMIILNIVLTTIFFALSYIKFMLEEIRSF